MVVPRRRSSNPSFRPFWLETRPGLNSLVDPMITTTLRAFMTPAAALFLAAGLSAQAPKLEFPAPSPAASVKQRVGITDIELSYNRPSMKGRKIFGGLVPYGEVWRTGANTATKLTFSTDVKLGGANVPAGSYALYTIPGADEWTVILNKVTGQWGAYQYDAANDLVRIKAQPVALANPVETFGIGFADLRDNSATMYLTWEKVRVPVKLEIDTVGLILPRLQAAMAGEGKKPYFSAAMFYYDNNLDLKQALEWMNAAVAEQPDAMWMVYRKGLILAKLGDKAGAIAAAKQSMEMAQKAQGGIKDEYIRLSQALIDSQK